MDSVGEGEGGMIWENGIETCIISYMKQVASPGSMHNTGCLGWCTGTTQSPVVFKHGCSLETYLELWRKSNTWAFIFFKKFQDNSGMHPDFKN